MLLDLLLETIKFRRGEKFAQCNSKTVAKFLNGGNSGAVVSSADNVIHSGLGNAANAAELVDGDVMLLA